MSVQISVAGNEVFTQGRLETGEAELSVIVGRRELVPEAEYFLEYVLSYLEHTGRSLKPDETFLYGYWVTRFVPAARGLEVWERNRSTAEFKRGADLALMYWKDQQAVCQAAGAEFDPPPADRLAMVSAGVREGQPVEGVRYPSPENMSGWWLTTNQYDGHVESLKAQHLFHVTGARHDLARYLALPPGFRFFLGPDAGDIWFDRDVAGGR